MGFSLAYLFYRFFYRLADFFHHWYFGGSKFFARKFISALEDLDRAFAIRITIKYFFQPLYKDYTLLGRLLGVIFRSGRIFIAMFVYALISAFFVSLYLIWLTIPLALIIKIITNAKLF